MNVQRLRHVLIRLHSQLETSQVEQKLQDLQTKLERQVSNPTDSSIQTEVSESLARLREALQTAQDDPTGTFWLEAIGEIKLQRLLPSSIFANAASILDTNQITPAVALQQINDLRNDIADAKNRITQTIEALGWLGFADISIPEDKAEIGILVPRSAVNNNLDDFGEEAHDLNTLLNAIAQAVTGEAENIQIESVSSSEFLFYVWLAPIIVKCFASAAREIIAMYSDFLKVKTYREQLEGTSIIGKAILDAIDKDNELNISHRIETIVDNILSESNADDAGKNDLRNRLRNALNALWNRYSKGYSFDVRASDKSVNSDNAEIRETAQTINEIAKTLERTSIRGEKLVELPAALDLPEQNPDGDEPMPT